MAHQKQTGSLVGFSNYSILAEWIQTTYHSSAATCLTQDYVHFHTWMWKLDTAVRFKKIAAGAVRSTFKTLYFNLAGFLRQQTVMPPVITKLNLEGLAAYSMWKFFLTSKSRCGKDRLHWFQHDCHDLDRVRGPVHSRPYAALPPASKGEILWCGDTYLYVNAMNKSVWSHWDPLDHLARLEVGRAEILSPKFSRCLYIEREADSNGRCFSINSTKDRVYDSTFL